MSFAPGQSVSTQISSQTALAYASPEPILSYASSSLLNASQGSESAVWASSSIDQALTFNNAIFTGDISDTAQNGTSSSDHTDWHLSGGEQQSLADTAPPSGGFLTGHLTTPLDGDNANFSESSWSLQNNTPPVTGNISDSGMFAQLKPYHRRRSATGLSQYVGCLSSAQGGWGLTACAYQGISWETMAARHVNLETSSLFMVSRPVETVLMGHMPRAMQPLHAVSAQKDTTFNLTPGPHA